MKQYEAARKFLELIQKHPEGFTATYESDRGIQFYVIKNKYRAVSISIKQSIGCSEIISPIDDSRGIMLAEDDVIEQLIEIASNYIEEEKLQKVVDSDNTAIYELIKFYDKK